MKKLLFLLVSAFFVIGCGGGGTSSTPFESNYIPIDAEGTVMTLPIVETVQGGTSSDPAPLTPLDFSDLDLQNPDLFITHEFGTDEANNYFEYTAIEGETLIIAITFKVPLTSDEMDASPEFLKVYDSALQPAVVIHDGGSETITELYMVYAIKFTSNDTYLLQFGWEGHGGYATIASIAP